MNNAAFLVTENLNFDMMRILDVFLNIDPGIAKRFFRFASRRVITFHERNVIMRHTHPASAAASNGFDHHRIPDVFGDGQGLRFFFNDAIRSWR